MPRASRRIPHSGGSSAQLSLGNQVAGGRIRSRKFDARGFAHQAPSAIAPDQIFCSQRLAVAERDVDAAAFLREACNFTSAVDLYPKFVDPAAENSLDVPLPQCEPIVVAGGKVTDVQADSGEHRDLRRLAL